MLNIYTTKGMRTPALHDLHEKPPEGWKYVYVSCAVSVPASDLMRLMGYIKNVILAGTSVDVACWARNTAYSNTYIGDNCVAVIPIPGYQYFPFDVPASRIPSGVHSEISRAINSGIPVFGLYKRLTGGIVYSYRLDDMAWTNKSTYTLKNGTSTSLIQLITKTEPVEESPELVTDRRLLLYNKM